MEMSGLQRDAERIAEAFAKSTWRGSYVEEERAFATTWNDRDGRSCRANRRYLSKSRRRQVDGPSNLCCVPAASRHILSRSIGDENACRAPAFL
jgi:hypothetical protein